MVRIEFVAGESALNYIQKLENSLNIIMQSLSSNKGENSRVIPEEPRRHRIIQEKSKGNSEKSYSLGSKICFCRRKKLCQEAMLRFTHTNDDQSDDEFHISVGEKSVEMDPSLIYVAVITKGEIFSSYRICR